MTDLALLAVAGFLVGFVILVGIKLRLALPPRPAPLPPHPDVEGDLLLLPCPYCGLRGGHTGLCQLSQMRTGEYYVVYAKPLRSMP